MSYVRKRMQKTDPVALQFHIHGIVDKCQMSKEHRLINDGSAAHNKKITQNTATFDQTLNKVLYDSNVMFFLFLYC